MKRPLADRFWEKVDRRGPAECWPWTGYVTPQGYGKMFHEIVDSKRRYEWAHRVSWLLATGSLPPIGMHLDHVEDRGCTRRDCVNPAHLEVVTPAENALRGHAPNVVLHLGGTCANGHPRSESRIRRSTGRVAYCKTCRREQRQAARR